ncbi:hypothetical protein B0T13DRAFT_534337 [Neurospora crassa]|nr:hypothetical protein B0T13DRAFT_534337 [Neurospora crassa]
MSDTTANTEAAPAVETVQTEVQTETVEAPVAEAAPAAEEAPKTEDASKEEEKKPEATKSIDRADYKNNRKYDPSTQPVTDDPVKIRNQVEFYFSDSNLPTDKFMWETTGGVENKPVSLKTICSFKRMQMFQPYSAVVAALKESAFLDVSGEEGQETVKRKKAYTSSSDAQKARLAASVYVKGFGEETGSTQFDIEAFFTKFGQVNLVKLRRNEENKFKGSVFVEFKTEDEANAFVALNPAPKWQDQELVIKKKKDYLDEKTQLIKEGKMEPGTSKKKIFFEGSIKGAERGRGRGGRSGGDKGDWKSRRDNDQRNGFKGGRGRGRGGRGSRGGRGGRDNRDRNNDNNNKRAREDDGDKSAEPAAKKVDTKTEAVEQQ